MARDQLTYLWTSLGDKPLSLGARPTKVTFTVSQKFNDTADHCVRFSLGVVTDGLSGTFMNCHSLYGDAPKYSRRYEDRVVSVLEKVGTVVVEALRVDFKEWTSNGMIVTVSELNGSDYIVDVEFET